MSAPPRLAIVVPTRNRRDELRRMLQSLADQSVRPDQLIVVDGSDEPIKDVVESFPQFHAVYLRVMPPSLSRQRNAGMAALDRSITLAGYLDDDLVLLPGSLEAMMRFWTDAGPEVGGARFNIVSDRLPRAIGLRSLFGTEARRRGAVLRGGFPTMVGPIAKDQPIDWASGGATIWRRNVIREFAYDEWFQGTGFLEDVDYSFRVSRRYKIMAVAEAKVLHLSHPVRPDRQVLLGTWEVVNRAYLVRKHPQLSRIALGWGVIGQLLLNVVGSIATADRGLLRRARGNLRGIARLATGRTDPLGGHMK